MYCIRNSIVYNSRCETETFCGITMFNFNRFSQIMVITIYIPVRSTYKFPFPIFSYPYQQIVWKVYKNILPLYRYETILHSFYILHSLS